MTIVSETSRGRRLKASAARLLRPCGDSYGVIPVWSTLRAVGLSVRLP
jgi:hypothetical protein